MGRGSFPPKSAKHLMRSWASNLFLQRSPLLLLSLSPSPQSVLSPQAEWFPTFFLCLCSQSLFPTLFLSYYLLKTSLHLHLMECQSWKGPGGRSPCPTPASPIFQRRKLEAQGI